MIAVINYSTLWTGRRLDNLASILEGTAEKLRLLAILTRITP
jgi:hypothetical protein